MPFDDTGYIPFWKPSPDQEPWYRSWLYALKQLALTFAAMLTMLIGGALGGSFVDDFHTEPGLHHGSTLAQLVSSIVTITILMSFIWWRWKVERRDD